MSEHVGYVVIEFNQASGQPELADMGFLYESRDQAQAIAEIELEENRRVGRRERYAVATVTIEEEDE